MNGFFLLQFLLGENGSKVLEGGPWLIGGRVFILKKWERGLDARKDLLQSVPMRVRFPQLGLHLWSSNIIGRIASTIGKPLYMEKQTYTKSPLVFARVCIEVNRAKKQPSIRRFGSTSEMEALRKNVSNTNGFLFHVLIARPRVITGESDSIFGAQGFCTIWNIDLMPLRTVKLPPQVRKAVSAPNPEPDNLAPELEAIPTGNVCEIGAEQAIEHSSLPMSNFFFFAGLESAVSSGDVIM